MKLDLVKPSLVLVSLSIVGCSATAGDSPVLTATGAVVAQRNMPEYCQRAASSEYGVQFENVKTNGVVARGGGFLVKGTAATVQQTYRFTCQFDSGRRFMGVGGQ
jgi:hypothetical protein